MQQTMPLKDPLRRVVRAVAWAWIAALPALTGCSEPGGAVSSSAVPSIQAPANAAGPSSTQAQSQGSAEPFPQQGDFMAVFDDAPMPPDRHDQHVKYDLVPSSEHFFVHVPAGYSDQGAYGLVVFVDAGDEENGEPEGWQPVLDGRKLLYIAPQNAGNDQDVDRRMGLAVMAAQEMRKHYRIDPRRVYVAGFSGGARMADWLGFYQFDVFHGTIQNCGADFYVHVPQVVASSQLDTGGHPYGTIDADAEEVAGARTVHFALITGSNDFRRGNIVDIYNGGFAQYGFQAKLFDVPGMSHDAADPVTLSAVLDFIDPKQ